MTPSPRDTTIYHFSGTEKSEIWEIRCRVGNPYSLFRRCAASTAHEEARDLRRMYSTYPGGLPGSGLLLLRAAIGVRLAIQGFAWIAESQSLRAGTWAPGLLAFVIGLSFLAGFLTRLAGVLLALAGAAIHLWHPAWHQSIASLLSFNIVLIAVAISLLGPGSFSLDARFFGRRKIIIPRVASS